MSATKVLTVEDRFAIQELLARYCRFLDAGFVDAFVACFAPDCAIMEERVEDVDCWHGHDGARRLFARYRGATGVAGRRHHVGRVLMDGNGENVAVKSFSLVTERHGEPSNRLRFAGFYIDEVVRRETRWVFKSRIIRRWDSEALQPLPGHVRWLPANRHSAPVAGTERDGRA